MGAGRRVPRAPRRRLAALDGALPRRGGPHPRRLPDRGVLRARLRGRAHGAPGPAGAQRRAAQARVALHARDGRHRPLQEAQRRPRPPRRRPGPPEGRRRPRAGHGGRARVPLRRGGVRGDLSRLLGGRDAAPPRGAAPPRRKPKKATPARRPRKTLHITASVGAAAPNGRVATPSQVLEAADSALYRAKRAGRNRVAS
ncbi:MAG: hypothetical protein DME06_00185 [Candidatus Rokuibacteriota bacterium]|nr:MAG: hypothetical protein DME06_00185 [Candidatus Rokubacteria bacterium]